LYIFFIGMIIRAINFYSLLPSTFDSIFFKLIGISGVLLLGIDFIIKFNKRKVTYNILLIAYMVILVITSFVHKEYGLGENLKTIMWAILQYFLIYQFAFENSDNKRFFKRISWGFIYSWFVLVSMSMVLFFGKFGYEKYYNARHRIRIGFLESRLFGTFSDINNAAIASLVVIVLILFYLYNKKVTGLNKIIFLINLPLQFIYIVLSGSRSTYVVSIIIVAISSFIVVLKRNGTKKDLKNYILAIVSSIGSVLILFALFNATKILFQELLPHLKEINFFNFTERHKELMNNSQHINNTQTPDNTLVRKDVAENTDISNARITIWKSAWEIFKTSWLIGVSPKNVVSYAQSIIPDGYIAKVGIAIHNAYLNVLTSTGILGIIPFMAFLIKSFVLNVYRIIYNKCIGKDYHFVYCLVILSYALYAALNNELVYENTVGTFVFWLFLGRVNSKNNSSYF
ncbi:O-antigen ligase family protein, partial [Enterococcus faecium]|nr:O-antigen ligase family protein [Enterococcus faecium]HAP9434306.1 O-antigen ligase family protein [Enterococcus faecium]